MDDLEYLKEIGTKIYGSERICPYIENIAMLKHHTIPAAYPGVSEESSHTLGKESLIFRDLITSLSGCVFLSYEWIKPLARWIGPKKCLEIMAGSGSLSYGLQQCGVDIIATDDYSYGNVQKKWFDNNQWVDVKKVECVEAIKQFGQERDIVLCAWPEQTDRAYYSLLKMREINPKAMMIYIGEFYGATADENFMRTVKLVNDEQFEEIIKKYKRCYGIYDNLFLIN